MTKQALVMSLNDHQRSGKKKWNNEDEHLRILQIEWFSIVFGWIKFETRMTTKCMQTHKNWDERKENEKPNSTNKGLFYLGFLRTKSCQVGQKRWPDPLNCKPGRVADQPFQIVGSIKNRVPGLSFSVMNRVQLR